MKKALSNSLFLILGLCLTLLPWGAEAAAVKIGGEISSSDISAWGFFSHLMGCGVFEGGSNSITPLCILRAIVTFAMAIAFGVALIFLVIGGFRYVTAQGNEDAVEKAKSTITHSIVGIVVIFLAIALIYLALYIAGTGSAGVNPAGL